MKKDDSKLSKNLIWCDLETTGLDFNTDVLLEISLVATDGNLNILGVGPSFVVYQPPSALQGMDQIVQMMHEKSGLLDEVPDGRPLDIIEKECLDWVNGFAEPNTVAMAGSNIGFDRRYLSIWMPDFHDWFHYRNADVSSFKEFTRRWWPKVFYDRPDTVESHRAQDDILESIAEARHYMGSLAPVELSFN